MIGQSFAIAQDAMSSLWQDAADVVVEPDVGGFAYDDFKRAGELMNAGEVAMRKVLPEVRKWLEAPAETTIPAKARARARRTSAPRPHACGLRSDA